jgi:hypothetical protein
MCGKRNTEKLMWGIETISIGWKTTARKGAVLEV